MQSRTKLTQSILTAAILTVASAPFAVTAQTRPDDRAGSFTLGGAVSSARFESNNFEGDDTGWKGFIATSFGDMIGAELAYNDFGQLGGSGGPDAEAYTAAGTLGVPLAWATPYGKAGWAFQDVEGTALTEEIDDDEFFYGVGLRFGTWQSPVGVRLEYERFEFAGDDLDLASLGLAFRFGGTR